MKLSYKWLKEYIDIDTEAEKLADILTKLGLEVEEIEDNAKKYKGFFTAKILEIKEHPNADKLNLCAVESVNGKQTVICGAPNVAVGQKVVLGTEGTVIPSAGFKLEKKKIRGIESNGMICSEAELELGDDSSGILELDEDAIVGVPLADHLDLNDIIFDIAITPNRGDCLSHFGIARDLAAYFRKEAKLPDIDIEESNDDVKDSIKVKVENYDACPRYTARVVRNVKIAESPDWLKKKIISIGLRPVNNAVDITNFVLMETGQPLHAFDLNEIKGDQIIVKNAKQNEKFTTLDDKERELNDEMLMICDAERAVAVAGVMGGLNSEISEDTTDILIESAYFDPHSVRKTAKQMGITSDSSYRFERGVDIDMVTYASDRAAQLLADIAGGLVEKGIVDNYSRKKQERIVELRYERARKVIGLNLDNIRINEIFEALNFEILDYGNDKVELRIPSYRHDIELEIDLIEEIARIYNYDNIGAQYYANITFDARETPEKLAQPKLRDKIRNYLINSGYNESVTLNQLDPKSSEIFIENPVRVANPLGKELSRLRPSLIPSMLKVIERNLRLGNKNLRLFETGKVFSYEDDRDSFIEGISERESLLLVMTGDQNPSNWSTDDNKTDFYDIKGLFESLSEFIKLQRLKFEQNSFIGFGGNCISISSLGQQIGKAGELDKRLLKDFDIEQEVYAIELDLTTLYKLETKEGKYDPVSPYPSIERDIAFVIDKNLEAGKILDHILENGGKFLKSADIFDVYTGDKLGENKKSVAYSLKFVSTKRTLKDEEVDKVIDKLIEDIENRFSAQLRKF